MDTAVITAIIMVISAAVMVSAAVSDWRTREVSDAHWMILGSAGIICFTLFCIIKDGFRWEYAALAVMSFMMLADLFIDTDRLVLPFYMTMGILAIASLYCVRDSPYFTAWASVAASYVIFVAMYITGLIQGGADVKCLISLAMAFPTYPAIGLFPLIGVPAGNMSTVFTFAISVLFLAAVIAVISALRFHIINGRAGYRGPGRYSGYEMDIADARKAHVWPMFDVENGELVRCGYPEETAEVFDRLEASGRKKTMVTPMIPFIVPMAAATLFLMTVGNPLFLI